MQNSLKYLFSFLIIAILGCSPSKLLEQKKYQQAYNKSMMALDVGKDVEKNSAVLHCALDSLILKKEVEIESLIAENKIKNTSRIINKQDKIINLIDKSEPYLGDEYMEYRTQLEERNRSVKLEAYTHYKIEGEDLLFDASDSGDKYMAQKAFFCFRTAKKFVAEEDREELKGMMKRAKEEGTIYYDISGDSWGTYKMDWAIDSQIGETEWESSSFLVINSGNSPDCSIHINFGWLDVDIDEDKNTLVFEEEVIDGYEVEVDTSGNEIRTPIYKTLSGEVEVRTKVRTLKLEADVSVSAFTAACRCGGNSFRSSKKETIEEYKTSGDESVIPYKYKTAFGQKFIDKEDSAKTLVEDIFEQFRGTYL